MRVKQWFGSVVVAVLALTACDPGAEPPEGAEWPVGGGGGAWPADGIPGPTASAPVKEPFTVQILAPTKPDGIADLVDRIRPAVVNIDTLGRSLANADDPFERYFENGPPSGPRQARGMGSGFVLRSDGLIVTNNHVVANASRLRVTFADGRKLNGRVVGTDPLTDVALVRVDAKNLTTLPLADPAKLRVGQYVVAMGSPLGLQQTVTSGILSALHRDIALNARVGFLQTDAPINPGNSGGPLLNLSGEVVGVNTAIAASAQGIGFAIPVDTLVDVLPELERTGTVKHAWIGIGAVDLPEDRSQLPELPAEGVIVGRVERGSPAFKAGVRPGDVIVSIDGQPVPDAAGLVRAIAKLGVGSRTTVELVRDGKRHRLGMVLEAMPANVAGG